MNNNNVKVGLFLTVGLTALIVSIFMLGSNKSLFQKSYTLITYFDSVQGLNNGAIVSIAGFKIGNVQQIDFDEKTNMVKVMFDIDADYAKKIRSDSVVEIKTQGALGDKFLYITPGQSQEIVKDGSELKSDYGNDILSIISKRGSESEKLFDTIQNLNIITKGLADNNKLPNLIAKLDTAAGHLNESSLKIKQSLQAGHLDRSLEKMDRILEKIDNGQGTLGALINDRSIHERLKNILGAGQKQQQVKSIIKSSVDE
ncbi:MAG: MlaD family protein [Pseudobdellovibrio sp.]